MFKAIIFHPGSIVFFLCYYNVALHVGLGRMASVSFSAEIYNKNLNYANYYFPKSNILFNTFWNNC